MSSQPSRDQFRRTCGRFATGVTIACVRGSDGAPHGLTVNSFTSVSLEPPVVLVCLAHTASVIEHFRQATHFTVNVLEESQQALSDRFARKGHDRFEGVAWRAGEGGAPLLDGALATLECSLRDRIRIGDHDVFTGDVLAAHWHEGRPLLYFSGYQTLK